MQITPICGILTTDRGGLHCLPPNRRNKIHRFNWWSINFVQYIIAIYDSKLEIKQKGNRLNGKPHCG